MAKEKKIRVHLIIEGRVQGVCYRMYASAEARRLGLSGWVKNLSDGNVELVAEGDSESVTGLVKWCRTGSPSATVTNIREDYSGAAGNEDGFEIRS